MEKTHPITRIDLLVAQVCDLACIYCYAQEGSFGRSGIMEQSTAERAVDWLINASRNSRTIHIEFFGGEPLLNFPVIEKTVLYAEQEGKKRDKCVSYSILTNGMNLTEKTHALLNSYSIEVRVSIDGPESIQNRQRPRKNHAGSYQQIVHNIAKALQETPGAIRNAHAVYMPGTSQYSVLDVVDHLKELGFPSVTVFSPINTLHGYKNQEGVSGLSHLYPLSEREGKEMYRAVTDRNREQLETYATSPVYLLLRSFLRRTILKKTTLNGNSAGRDYVAVDVRGDIYLHHTFVGISQYKMGSVFEDQLTCNPLGDVNTYPQECMTCPAGEVCAGGCLYTNAVEEGNLATVNNNWCSYMLHNYSIAEAVGKKLNSDDISFFLMDPEKSIGSVLSTK